MAVPATAEIWLADIESAGAASLQDWHAWLGESELARYQRFIREQRRRQFVAGRGLLRMALARLLKLAPSDIQLEEQVGKAPLLVLPKRLSASVAGFSISHSGRWAACAISAQTTLGLDIEIKDGTRDLAALAAQAFDAVELAGWRRQHAALPEAQRTEAFYRLWSEKEARFKLGASAAACIALPHEELSVVLCSGEPLAAVPSIEMWSAA